jgi:putative hydrolase of the HAD superfamily
MIKAILFDFGDTLVLFDRWNYDKCLRKMLDRMKKNNVVIPVSYEEFKRIYFEVRRNMYNQVKNSYGEVDFCIRLTKTLKRFNLNLDPEDPTIIDAADSFFEGWDEDMRTDDFVFSVLETLKTKYKLGIVSNFPHRKALLATLKRLGLSRFFDAIVISAELGVRKPHPRIFVEALKKLNAKAFEAVFVGDTLKTDIFGAQNVGMKTILVENAELKKNRYAAPGDLDQVTAKPDCKIADLRELTAAVAALLKVDSNSRVLKMA